MNSHDAQQLAEQIAEKWFAGEQWGWHVNMLKEAIHAATVQTEVELAKSKAAEDLWQERCSVVIKQRDKAEQTIQALRQEVDSLSELKEAIHAATVRTLDRVIPVMERAFASLPGGDVREESLAVLASLRREAEQEDV